MSLIHNEQTKLTATLLNNVAMAFVAAGVVTPLIAYFYGIGAGAPIGVWRPSGGAAIWFLTGIGIHLAARRILRSLRT
jgi:hypothetical protein